MAISFCHSRNTDLTPRHSLLVGEPTEELVGETDGEKGGGVQVGHDLVQDLSRQPAEDVRRQQRDVTAVSQQRAAVGTNTAWMFSFERRSNSSLALIERLIERQHLLLWKVLVSKEALVESPGGINQRQSKGNQSQAMHEVLGGKIF